MTLTPFSHYKYGRTVVCLLLAIFCGWLLISSFPTSAALTIQKIRVVIDDKYPPYIFRESNGSPQGILVDQWQLWEKTTGIKVELIALPWAEAIKRMQAGEFDVIDTLFYNEERAKLFSYLRPYAQIDVPLFFHSDLSGIRDAKDAVGFAVGAKAGDNVINVLKKAGVTAVVEYPSYEQLIQAAAEGKTKVFSVDRPPALYYLNKFGIADQFRESPALYRGEFHRAVKKGNTELAAIIQHGFDSMAPEELEKINSSWIGKPLNNKRYWHYLGYIVAFATAIIAMLGLWLLILRQMVQNRTAELVIANDALKKEIAERQIAEMEKSKLQNQLQQAMKMEAVGRLAGGVAHDFNNLLTAIIGNASLALLDLPPENHTAESLREIEKAGRDAALLTQQLLAFSRRQNIEPKILKINDIITSQQKMLTRMAGNKVNLELHTADDLGNVMLDPGQFERILTNLVFNARDVMPEGGRIVISTTNVALSTTDCLRCHEAQPGEYVRLTFSDTGHGMSAEVKEHLFEPFYTTKPRGRGTGLGLSAIYGIIKQSGGFIEVNSEEGKGTTFEIFLPRTDKQASTEVVTATAKICGGSETVLLVEDEDIVRFIGAEILRKLGYNILQAASGNEALAIVDKFPGQIDLLLTDLMMPGMNGRELAKRLTSLRPSTKVLFTSACPDDVIAGHQITDKGLNFIAKPYSIETLAIKLRQALIEDYSG